MARRTRRPAYPPAPWKIRGWQAAPNALTSAPLSPSPWADTEQWLRELLDAGTLAAVRGAAGVWEVTTAHGHRVTVTAETDAAIREAAAILEDAPAPTGRIGPVATAKESADLADAMRKAGL